MNPFAGGDATLSYTIRNTGNTVIAALHGTDVSGPFGIFSSEVQAEDDLPQLLPGETWDVTTVVHVAPMVWLTGTATVVPLALDAAGTTSQFDPVYAKAGTLAVPWMLLLLLAVVGALVWLGIRLSRASAVRRQEREDERVQEAVQQALNATPADASEQGESDPADPEPNPPRLRQVGATCRSRAESSRLRQGGATREPCSPTLAARSELSPPTRPERSKRISDLVLVRGEPPGARRATTPGPGPRLSTDPVLDLPAALEHPQEVGDVHLVTEGCL